MRRRDLAPFVGMYRRWFVRVEWKPQDCWLGVFWKRTMPAIKRLGPLNPPKLDVWVCLVPMLPVHFGWRAAVAHAASGPTEADPPTPDNPSDSEPPSSDGQPSDATSVVVPEIGGS